MTLADVEAHLVALIQGGTRWQAQGLDPVRGCDCYGFVRYCYGLLGIVLPQDVLTAETAFMRVAPPYQPLDVLLCRSLAWQAPRHLALLTSATTGYHCSKASNGVARFQVHGAIWQRMIRQGWRFKEHACV